MLVFSTYFVFGFSCEISAEDLCRFLWEVMQDRECVQRCFSGHGNGGGVGGWGDVFFKKICVSGIKYEYILFVLNFMESPKDLPVFTNTRFELCEKIWELGAFEHFFFGV